MSKVSLKNLVVLDESVNPGDVNEQSMAELGLKVIYVKTIEEAEKYFDESKDEIGLIYSEVYCDSSVTAGFLRRVLKFNTYHRVEIPIILTNDLMDQGFMDRMKTKFSEVIKKPHEHEEFLAVTTSALLKNFLKYLKFLLLKCTQSPPVELPEELLDQCRFLLKMSDERIAGENDKNEEVFNKHLEDIVTQMIALGLGDNELVKDLGEVQQVIANGPSAESVTMMMGKNSNDLSEEDINILAALKENGESSVTVKGKEEDAGKVLDLNPKLEDKKGKESLSGDGAVEDLLNAVNLNTSAEEMNEQLDKFLIKAIHQEIDGIDEHTFDIDESEIREEVLSVIRSLKGLTEVDVTKVYGGLSDIQSELRKVDGHVDIEDNIIKIVRLNKMKEAAEKLTKISGEFSAPDEQALVKGAMSKLSECLKVESLNNIEKLEEELVKVKGFAGEDLVDDIIKVAGQVKDIAKVELELTTIKGEGSDKKADIIKIKQSFCENLISDPNVKISSATEKIVEDIQIVKGGGKVEEPVTIVSGEQQTSSEKLKEDSDKSENTELEAAKKLIKEEKPKEKYQMRSEYEKLKCDILDRKNKDGQTCLMLAAEAADRPEVDKQLEDGADPTFKSKDGRTVLHYAAAGGDLEIFELLLEKKQKLTSFDNNGNTPLFTAIRKKRIEIIERVLPETGNKNFANKEGETALMLGAQTGDLEIFKILLKSGINPKLKDKKMKPLSFYAKKGKNKKILALAKKLEV